MAEEFMPNFAKRKSFFDKEKVDVDKRNPFPYDASVAERAYNNWKKQVINPGTNEYYTVKDSQGVEKKARHTVNEIVRIKTTENDEFLFTLGTLTGYDHDGNSVTVNCSQPEMYEETIFHHRSIPGRDNHMVQITDSIQEIVKHYDLPFNEKNVDMLLAKQRPSGCQLSVRNARNDTGKTCEDVEVFKQKSFNYILNDERLTSAERENAIKEHQVLQGEVIATNQRKAGTANNR